MARIEKALVVGGGVGGMSVALALAQKGIHVHVVEVQREWKVYGVGIIQPSNALRALDKLD